MPLRRPRLPRDDSRAEEAEEEARAEGARAAPEQRPLRVRDLTDRAARTLAIRTLLAGAIDYAGLFPPAALSMSEAARNYSSYRDGPHAWALGRFVVPIARLSEFGESAGAMLPRTGPPWRLSALAGAGGADDWPAVATSGLRGALVDALELRAPTPDEVLSAAARLPKDLDVFYEIPIDDDPTRVVAAIGRAGGKAKARTGGVTPEAFPRPADLARFMVACARAAVPFKATAGLHHPIRAAYRLTYEAHSPRADMFGFMNVLLAAASARAGFGAYEVADVLTERDAGAFRFDADGVEWRDRRVDARALGETRAALALSFGSCSFAEPIAELEELGLL